MQYRSTISHCEWQLNGPESLRQAFSVWISLDFVHALGLNFLVAEVCLILGRALKI